MVKKEKKKKGDVEIDGVKTSELSREKLEQFALKLREECDREREERNYFQIERDKLRTYWELTKEHLEEARAELRNKDREIEETKDKTDDKIKLFRQKIKHLNYEQQNNIAEIRAEAMVSLKLAQDEHSEQENQLLKDKTELKTKLREQESAYNDIINNLKLNQSEKISKARENFEKMVKEIEAKYERKLFKLKEDLSIQHKTEIMEVEERKNTQINELIKQHEIAFSNLKTYYNDITLNSLALISNLKQQMETLNDQCKRLTKQANEISSENKKLVVPLQELKIENKELKRQLQNYEKDKQSLKNNISLVEKFKKNFNDLKWEHEALELKYDKLEAERNILYERFTNTILELQQRTDLKHILLQKRIEELEEELEKKEAKIFKITRYLDRSVLEKDDGNFEKIIERKNERISDLEYELERITKAHNDIIHTYELKLQKYGISKKELGFTPLKVSQLTTVSTNLSPEAAGLVARNK